LWIELIGLEVDNLQMLCVQPHNILDNKYGTIASCKIYPMLGGNNIEMQDVSMYCKFYEFGLQ